MTSHWFDRAFQIPPGAIEQAKTERQTTLARRSASQTIRIIPRAEKGGTVEVWQNADGSWECADSRFSSAEIAGAIAAQA
jgi:hypothetical protein